MRPRLHIALITAATLSGIGTTMAGAYAQSPDCFASWTDAAPMVRREGLATIERVHRLARSHAVAEIVNGKLCQDGGRFVYHLVVRDARGPLKSMVVDAKEPFGR